MTALRTTAIEAITAGMRLRSTLSGYANQIVVTDLTPTGFKYKIADDEEPIHPHWSMRMEREGHEAFAIEGRVCWEPVA